MRAARITGRPSLENVSGDVLLSHAVARAVPSALRGLASGFGMGPGVSLSLWSPKHYGDMVRPLGSGDRTSGTAQWTRQRAKPAAKNCPRAGPENKRFVASPRPISTG